MDTVGNHGSGVKHKTVDEHQNGATLSPTGQAALAYTDAGYFVVPLCWPTQSGGCGCPKHHTNPKEIGKAPLLGNGYEETRLTRAQVIGWWLRHPLANVGILLEPSGLFVIDADSLEADREIERRGVPPGPRATTPRPGVHRYCRNAHGIFGRATKKGESGKIDVLSLGYVVAPPSRTPWGEYAWEIPLTDIALDDPPAWAVKLLAEQKTSASVITLDGALAPVDLNTLSLDSRLVEVIQHGRGATYISRSEAVFAVEVGLLNAGCSVETIASILLDPRYAISEKPREQGRKWLLSDIARAQVKLAEAQPDGAAPAPAPPDPIQVNNKALHVVSGLAQQALLAQNTPPFLFMRSGQVARIIHDEEERPIIETVGEAAMRGYLTRAVEFVRVLPTKKEDKPTFFSTRVSPPRDVVQDILSLPTKPFPPLLGVVESPVLRPDGSILAEAGYDPATRLFYHAAAGLEVPPLADCPQRHDAEIACEWIQDELLPNFPFLEPADKSNFLACLLTPVIRPALQKGMTPLALLDKPTSGSGASLLSDLVAIILTGEHAAKLSAPEGRNAEAEWEKKLTSLLLDGSPVGVIDNVEEEALSSAALSRFLTAGIWKERLLGGNVMASLPVRVTLIATGNNIALRGDLARRCYRVRLDPHMERPWERSDFKHPNLVKWTREERGPLLSALLTIARAWFVAGKPASAEQLPKLGNFDEWTRMVGGMLSFAGVTGFLGNQQALYDLVDDVGPQWRGFLAAWFDQFGDRWLTVRHFAGSASTLPATDPLIESLPEDTGWDSDKLDSSRIKLGKALKKQAFRVYGAYRLERGGEEKHVKVAQWRVKKL